MDNLVLRLESIALFGQRSLHEPSIGFSGPGPEFGYLLWLRPPNSPLQRNTADWLYEKLAIRVLDGRIFGSGGEGFFRINLALRPRTLELVLQRLTTLNEAV